MEGHGSMTVRDRITIVEGDITRESVDAIVNAANTTLLGGGGVDGAIHRAAGPELLEECRAIGGCPTGEARITKGYRLPAPWVVHTPGPVWGGGQRGEDDALASCYRSCFAIAEERRFGSIAFPAISTGVYRFPLDRATRIALKETAAHLERNPVLTSVRFVCFGRTTFETYERLIEETVS